MGRCLVTQTLVGPAVVIVGKVRLEVVVQVVAIIGRIWVAVFPFNRVPAVLDEGVIGGAAPAGAAASG